MRLQSFANCVESAQVSTVLPAPLLHPACCCGFACCAAR
jgi:hypothetical protein